MEPDRSPSERCPTAEFSLEHDSWGRLVLIGADGDRYVGIEPVRGFPLSDPEHWIALCDSEGRELMCIESPAELPPAIRRTLEDELARREFVPILQAIVHVTSDTFPCDWEVETDRGRTRFTLDSEDELRALGPHRVLITDAQGIRYLIADVQKLDAASRKVLERYL